MSAGGYTPIWVTSSWVAYFSVFIWVTSYSPTFLFCSLRPTLVRTFFVFGKLVAGNEFQFSTRLIWLIQWFSKRPFMFNFVFMNPSSHLFFLGVVPMILFYMCLKGWLVFYLTNNILLLLVTPETIFSILWYALCLWNFYWLPCSDNEFSRWKCYSVVSIWAAFSSDKHQNSVSCSRVLFLHGWLYAVLAHVTINIYIGWIITTAPHSQLLLLSNTCLSSGWLLSSGTLFIYYFLSKSFNIKPLGTLYSINIEMTKSLSSIFALCALRFYSPYFPWRFNVKITLIG